MPRRKDGIKRIEMRCFVSEALYNKIYLVLLDPFTNKPRYGVLSQISERLWAEWLREVQEYGLPSYLKEN